MLKFPYTFTDITYIMRMNDHGDKFHLSNKQFLNTTKQTSRTSKTPKTNQNQLFLFSVLTKISMQHVNFPYAFADITYIMRMNDHGDKFHLSNKQFLNTTKQTSRTSKTPKTNQNQLFLFSVLTKISMQHVNFPYAFADITYIMHMNDYGDKIHGAKKRI